MLDDPKRVEALSGVSLCPEVPVQNENLHIRLTCMEFRFSYKIPEVTSLMVLVSVLVTFLEKMFCKENAMVDAKALNRPIILKLSSVSVATATPTTIGTKLRYTFQVCFSLRIILEKNTVKKGIVAFTGTEPNFN